ncbi:MAG: ACT domain-containing protein [Ruminococcaceae bacterium]|nr:ACT domain-containing protein [Oscillospiraceae bacterium]
MKAIITVIGKDKSGIIAKVSTKLAENDVNIEDISQTIMQEYFTMVMLVDISNTKLDFTKFVSELKELGNSIGVDIYVQHEDIFNSMHKI